MQWVKDIWGTIFPEFKIGKVTLDAGSMTANRRLYLPDADGDLIIDANQDGKQYARKDGAWEEVTAGGGGGGGGIEEAPTDGLVYGRRLAGWVEVTSSGSRNTFDGGSAASVYIPEQNLNGGGA